MAVELVKKQPDTKTIQRVVRIQADAIALSNLDAAELRGIYENLEAARDRLSRLLDRADDKDA